MATVYLAPTFGVGYQCFTTGGLVNNGGYIDTFQAGTTTVTSVYTTSLGTVAHANPIVLGSDGRLPAGGEMWFLGGVAMKLVIKDSTSSAIQTLDNLYGVNDPTSINNIGPSGATVSAAINMNLAPINEAQGANIPVAAVVNLTTATGNYLAFTGSGTVTSITLSPAGVYREAVITNTCAFTNNANILMLGASSVTANPGDILGFRGEASGVVRNVMLSGSKILQQVGSQTGTAVFSGPSFGSTAAPPTFRVIPQPTRQVFTSGVAQTYTTPAGATRINVRMVGGGGGGAGATANNGTIGNNTTFSTFTASGGGGGIANAGQGGVGGAAAGGSVNIPGSSGQGGGINATAGISLSGGQGGSSAFGGGGGGGQGGSNAQNGSVNSGGGGGGGGGPNASVSGGGGGAGGYVEAIITVPAATYTYTVGAAANGGAAGGTTGGNGAAGIIIVDEFYN